MIPTCRFGQPSVAADGKAPGYYGEHHCAECCAWAEQQAAAFREHVRRGRYDSAGYCPDDVKEWKAHLPRLF